MAIASYSKRFWYRQQLDSKLVALSLNEPSAVTATVGKKWHAGLR